jgi:hypothetical protein
MAGQRPEPMQRHVRSQRRKPTSGRWTAIRVLTHKRQGQFWIAAVQTELYRQSSAAESALTGNGVFAGFDHRWPA